MPTKPIPLDQIPSLKRAIARAEQEDADRRDLAFLTEAPRVLCGVPVRALTLRHLLYLFLSRSPFVCGGTVGCEHILQFIHLVSPEFAIGNTKARREARRAFMQRLVKRVRFNSAVRAIDDYISDAWKDRPATSGKSSVQFASMAGSMVHEFAWAYGWQIDYVLDRPLAQLYQLLRHIAREDNPKAPLFAGAADKVKGKWLRAQSQKNKRAAEKRARKEKA